MPAMARMRGNGGVDVFNPLARFAPGATLVSANIEQMTRVPHLMVEDWSAS